MADFQAFRALRYDLARVGSLSDVTAPPYDVIDSEFQAKLYEQHENNIVRIILNRGDELHNGEDIYQSAARYLKLWTREGVLKRDSIASIYVYHQKFDHQGNTYRRRGFISRVKIEPFGEGRIYPHEETHSKAREDRINLTKACNANLSQIFSVYSDPTNEIQQILEEAIADKTPLSATDHLGVEHELWIVNDPTAISKAAALFGDKALYVADGHHRYETATAIRDERRAAEDLPSGHAVDYVSMTCVSMDDPGMIVLPTHRLFRGLPPISSSQLIEKLGEYFDCEIVGEGLEQADDIWQMIEIENKQSTMAFYCRNDNRWILARMTKAGESRMKELNTDRSDDWRSLGVSILHEMVVKELLGVAESDTPKYVRKLEEFVQGLDKGDSAGRDATGQTGSGKPFELGCLVMPATLSHIKAVSENGERMPAKSTYFYPKLLTGLVINPLD